MYNDKICNRICLHYHSIISQNYVVCDMFEDPKTWDVEHISLAKS